MISETYNIDCLEYMRGLPENYFSLAICDPPYGIGAGSMAQGKWRTSRMTKKIGINPRPNKNILLNYLEFQKIKSFSVEIIFYFQRHAGL